MNRGLVRKAVVELWPMTLGFAAALMIVEGVLGYVLPTFQQQFSAQLLQIAFLQKVISAMLGVEVAGGNLGPEIFASVPWVHPVPLALMWTLAIVICTRVPAGEVDRGTIDVLLGLPVTRRQVFVSESLVMVGATMAVLVCGGLGSMIGGASVAPELRAPPARLIIVLVNFLCLNLAVGGIAWTISSFSDRRGRAIGAVLAIVLSLFLLNYLSQFWKPAERLSFLSILRYYRPLNILRNGDWPWRDLVVLTLAATMFWVIGGWVFARRDLCTT